MDNIVFLTKKKLYLSKTIFSPFPWIVVISDFPLLINPPRTPKNLSYPKSGDDRYDMTSRHIKKYLEKKDISNVQGNHALYTFVPYIQTY